jgi:hypothetical protein
VDAIACERQFIDHAAPVWRLLPPRHRGRFLTDASLVEHARGRGIEAEAIDTGALRRSSLPPTANPGPGPAAFVVSIGDTKVARRLGYRRFAFMEHGAGQAYIGDRDAVAQRHPSYAGGVDREDVELFLVPNQYSAGLWRRAYPEARVDVVGSPKLEDLYQLVAERVESDRPVVAISFHWPAFTCEEAGSALGHYLKMLPALVAAYQVIGHAHPKGDWPARVARHYRRAGIPFVEDFADVVRQADVYVCDNSSTIFEFAATGRPVVVLNKPEYRRDVSHGGRFWDWATVGIQVDQPDALVPAIARALEDPPAIRAERERVLELVYPVRHGAGERAAAAIADWLTQPATVAA